MENTKSRALYEYSAALRPFAHSFALFSVRTAQRAPVQPYIHLNIDKPAAGNRLIVPAPGREKHPFAFFPRYGMISMVPPGGGTGKGVAS